MTVIRMLLCCALLGCASQVGAPGAENFDPEQASQVTPTAHADWLFDYADSERLGLEFEDSQFDGGEGLANMAAVAAGGRALVEAHQRLGLTRLTLNDSVLFAASQIRMEELAGMEGCLDAFPGDQSCIGAIEQQVPAGPGAGAGASAGGGGSAGVGGPLVLIAWIVASEVAGRVGDNLGYHSDPEVLERAQEALEEAGRERARADELETSITEVQQSTDKLIAEMIARRARNGRWRDK